MLFLYQDIQVIYQVRSRKVSFSSPDPLTDEHSYRRTAFVLLTLIKKLYWLRLSIHTAHRHLLQRYTVTL